MTARRALFLFHLRVGARLALRVLAPVLAAALFLYYVLRPEFSLELARILFIEGGFVESGLAGTLLLLGLARVVAPRIAAGSAGWTRSLPVAPAARRFSALLSLLVAEIPVLTVLGAFVWVITDPGPMPGAALAARLAEHALRFLPHVLGLIAGAAAAGRVARRDAPSGAFFQTLSLRAVGWRFALAGLAACAVLGGARLLLANNDLAPRAAFVLSLFGIVLGLTAFVGPAADILAARRPAWPWLRSLPRSAAARVRDDALLLALLALPLAALGMILLRSPARRAAYLPGPLAWLAVRGAEALREAGDRPFGALGHIAVEGAFLSLVLALLPWTSFLLAAASPVAFILARDAERRLKPTRWAERRHAAAGDPLSWSAS